MRMFTLPSSLLLALTILHCTTMSSAQAPALAPAPPGPANITGILEKAGQFSMFIRLMKSTQLEDQMNQQLNNSNQGLTIFAPPDNAFSSLKPGALNSLNDQEKVELMQFHVLPTVIPIAQFQTVSNPLRTQAGNANNGQFPLNVTAAGNQVNITTGVVDTTVANTIYTDSQLAIYQVDKVLLPLDLFGAPPPALAPKPEKGSPPSSADSPDSAKDSTDDSSEAMGLKQHAMLSVGVAVFSSFFL